MGYTGYAPNSLEDVAQSLQKDIHTWTKLQDLLKKFDGQKGSLVTVLQQVQDIYGYLPRPVMQYIAEMLKIKLAKIYGVATFYKQFRLTPMGKYMILLCNGTACHVNGSDQLAEALYEELRIREGETTADGLFTLSNVACLGCCSLAPVMMINGQTYGQLTPQKARQIVRKLVKKEKELLQDGELQ